jgi:hypothetical protein
MKQRSPGAVWPLGAHWRQHQQQPGHVGASQLLRLLHCLLCYNPPAHVPARLHGAGAHGHTLKHMHDRRDASGRRHETEKRRGGGKGNWGAEIGEEEQE